MDRDELRKLMIQLRKWRVLYGVADNYDPADGIVSRIQNQLDGAPFDSYGILDPRNG